MISFEVPGLPTTKQRARRGRNPKTGKAQWYTPEATASYEARIKKLAATHMMLRRRERLEHEPVELVLELVFPRPAKAPEGPRIRHTSDPDASNVLKAIEDGMAGVVYRDDNQIARLLVEKWIAASGEKPHVQVSVTELSW